MTRDEQLAPVDEAIAGYKVVVRTSVQEARGLLEIVGVGVGADPPLIRRTKLRRMRELTHTIEAGAEMIRSLTKIRDDIARRLDRGEEA